MPAKNRISISFSDEDFTLLERLSLHSHKSKAELVRIIVKEYLAQNPDRFRRETGKEYNREQKFIDTLIND